jgi:hypothetical protein
MYILRSRPRASKTSQFRICHLEFTLPFRFELWIGSECRDAQVAPDVIRARSRAEAEDEAEELRTIVSEMAVKT